MLMTGYVLASVACGGLTIMAAPLFFQGLLELRYPLPSPASVIPHQW